MIIKQQQQQEGWHFKSPIGISQYESESVEDNSWDQVVVVGGGFIIIVLIGCC